MMLCTIKECGRERGHGDRYFCLMHRSRYRDYCIRTGARIEDDMKPLYGFVGEKDGK